MHVDSLPMASVITQPHHLKHQDKEAWFLWYNLCLESCVAPLVASLMASVLVRGTPTLGAAVGHRLRRTIEQERHLDLSWRSTLGL